MARGRRARHRRGFTAVELLVTLAIVGVLLVAALPSLQGGLASSRARDAAEEVAARILYARRHAVTEGVPYLVVWANEHDLFVVRDLDQDLVADGGEPREGPYGLPDGVRMRIAPEDPFSANVIALRPSGDAHEAGSLEFRSGDSPAARLSVSSSGAHCVVTQEQP